MFEYMIRKSAGSIGAVVLFAALLLIPATSLSQSTHDYKYSPPTKLNDGIKIGTLRSANIDEAKIVSGTNEILKGTYPNIHSLLIFRHGKLVYENYFKGEDVERGVGPLGVVEHTRDTLHDMRSVTKSIVAAAVLVAHSQGKILSLDDPIFDYFPEYAKYADGDKKSITIKHVLTMTAGLEWDETIPYTDPKNSEVQMNRSANAVDYVLKKKLVAKPGTVFNYSGGCSQLLVALIKKATGMEADLYAEKNLFEPLGITKYKWVNTASGEPSAASGLRLRSRDMAKFGLLFMNDGKWNRKRILPASLARDSLRPHLQTPTPVPDGHLNYGYQIWLPTIKLDDQTLTFAMFEGNGGQIIFIDKQNDILMAVTAGNYNERQLNKYSVDIYFDIVLLALKGRK